MSAWRTQGTYDGRLEHVLGSEQAGFLVHGNTDHKGVTRIEVAGAGDAYQNALNGEIAGRTVQILAGAWIKKATWPYQFRPSLRPAFLFIRYHHNVLTVNVN